MLSRRHGSFAGGIDLPDEKQATLHRAIQPWRCPPALRVPLAPCGRSPARPVVRPGQHVAAGERLAEAVHGGVDVFAPLAGRVARLGEAEVAAPRGFVRVPAVELEDLAGPAPVPDARPVLAWEDLAPEPLRDRLARGGLTTARQPLQPLGRWIESARLRKCRRLIANALENQPYVTADHRLLVEHGIEVIRGLALLARALEVPEAILAVDWRRTDDYQALVGPARTHDVTRVALPHKYPGGADAMLLKVLTGREMPPGGDPTDLGSAVIGAAACLAAYRWAACGLAPVARVVTVAGSHLSPANFWVPFGASCADLVEGSEAPPIHGGPMTGLRCPAGAVVGPATDAVLAIEAGPVLVPSPCIRCGWCTDHCPARLNVAALNDHYELGLLDRAARAGAVACIECGVCSYVCPARLPLSQRVRLLKRAIRPRPDVPRAQPAGAGGA